MNKTQINSRLTPSMALIVYSTNREYSNDYYLESRQIKKQGEKYRFLAPSPVSQTMVRSLVKSFSQSKFPDMGFAGLIPDHLLYCHNKDGKTIVLWYRPSMQRSLNFSAALGLKQASMVHVPATLYLVIDTNLYVFAMMGDGRPGPQTKLYRAPFFNIYEDGHVCLGTAPIGRVKAKTFDEEAARFERGFYMAEQTGGHQGACKTDLKKLWQGLLKKPQPFPAKKEFVPHIKFKTLGDLYQKLIAPKNG